MSRQVQEADLRARRCDVKAQPLQRNIEQAASRQEDGVKVAASRLISSPRLFDTAHGIGNDRRVELADPLLVVMPVEVVLAHPRVQLAQQILLAIFAGARSLKRSREFRILTP